MICVEQIHLDHFETITNQMQKMRFYNLLTLYRDKEVVRDVDLRPGIGSFEDIKCLANREKSESRARFCAYGNIRHQMHHVGFLGIKCVHRNIGGILQAGIFACKGFWI